MIIFCKTKILNFFKGAIKDYEGDANLSREAKVQAVRAARNMAEEMIGGDQWRIGADGVPEKKGEGLAKIFSHISEEDEELFNTYLLHWHNTSK